MHSQIILAKYRGTGYDYYNSRIYRPRISFATSKVDVKQNIETPNTFSSFVVKRRAEQISKYVKHYSFCTIFCLVVYCCQDIKIINKGKSTMGRRKEQQKRVVYLHITSKIKQYIFSLQARLYN